jgi:hypothetical protein
MKFGYSLYHKIHDCQSGGNILSSFSQEIGKQEASARSGGLMPTLTTTVDGLKLPNPFVIGSGPPGTNLNVITRAFREG